MARPIHHYKRGMNRMNKTVALLCSALLATAFAGNAFAASFAGKVSANDGERVTLQVAKGAPAWARKGSILSAAGGMPTVVEVKGNNVTLKFSKAKAARIKTGMNLTVSEPPKGGGTEQLQGC